MKRLLLVAAGVLALVAGLTAPATAQEADPTPTLTVTPSAGLVDGQVVTVSATGWMPPNTANIVGVRLCPEDEQGCQRLIDPFEPESDGTFSRDVRVRTRVRGDTGPSHDCRVVPCRLVVSQYTGPTVEVPLSFDPSAPLAPPPVLTATPHTDLIGGQEVVLHGTGFFPDEDVWLTYCEDRSLDPYACLGGEVDVDAGGELTLTAHAGELIGHFRGSFDCRGTAPRCAYYAFEPVSRRVRAAAPLQLRPDGDEVVTARPTTGLVDGQTVTVDGAVLNEGHEVSVAQCVPTTAHPGFGYECAAASDPIVVPASRRVRTRLTVRRQWTWTDVDGGRHAVDCLAVTCEAVLFGDGVTFAANSYHDARVFARSVPLSFLADATPASPTAVTPAFTG